MQSTRRRPAPALLVAVIALVAALAGSAAALPGKNNVDKNDIKKKAVRTKALANNAVKSGKVADGTLTDADIADSEARHIVGAPGEPPFSNGGEGDCVWSSAHTQIPGFEPVSFYKDPTGHVHMTGIATSADGSGGDATCDSSVAGEEEDRFIFTLPAGYRPGNSQIQGLNEAIFVVASDQGLIAPPILSIPPGVVGAGTTGSFQQVGFDGTTYRTDAAGTASAEDGSANAAGRTLRRLLD